MKYIILALCLYLTSSILAQQSNIDIDGNSNLELFEGSKICVDDIVVQDGSLLWAYDYGQVKKSDCTVILTPTGSGTVTLPIEIFDSNALPTQFIIETAYPNPFNPVTNIKYGIPEWSVVKILLFDIRGHLIRELYKEDQEAGWYTITWDGLLKDGTIAPAGVYLMKIINTANNTTNFKSIKISLIK